MKTSVISGGVPRALPGRTPPIPNAFEGRAVVFDGPEDYHAPHRGPRARTSTSAACCSSAAPAPSVIRACAEVVNMRPPAAADQSRRRIACRASATVGSRAPRASPSILNASPEAADRRRPGAAADRRPGAYRPEPRRRPGILISDEELATRRAALAARGGYPFPESQTPWQELYRATVGPHATGACLELATGVSRISRHDSCQGILIRHGCRQLFSCQLSGFRNRGDEGLS